MKRSYLPAVSFFFMLVGFGFASEPLGPKIQVDKAPQNMPVALLDRGKIGDGYTFDLGAGARTTVKYVPGGEFLMGSPEDETDRGGNEDQVMVKLTSHYWMGETEVTQEQWEAVMGSNPSSSKGPGLPVEMVNWEDVQRFIEKLNAKGGPAAGWKWSLPTEAQWERACRGGTETAYSFGHTLNSTQANFESDAVKATTVKSYGANGYGLYDMHGNVWEWCLDWYGERLPGGVDPIVTQVSPSRVNRGGSWIILNCFCRSASRWAYAPEVKAPDVGFRLAVVPSK